MYGYLKYKNGNKVNKISRMYKCYYCSLCHALKKNYGILSTALLSYDLVFAAISLSSTDNYTDNKPICCLYKRKRKLSNEYGSDYWNGIATASVALAYSKALDNYLDKPTIISRMVLKLFNILSYKAKRTNPAIFVYLDSAMRKVKQAEDDGNGFETQSSLSAEMISSALCDYSQVSFPDANKSFLNAVSQWLCFVDAIDDYEKDRKKKSYNPLFVMWNDNNSLYDKSLNDLIKHKYNELAKIYFDIVNKMNITLKEMNTNENEKIFLNEMVHRIMPQKIGYIFSK